MSILASTADPDEISPHCLPTYPFRVCIIQRDMRGSAFEIVQTSLVSSASSCILLNFYQLNEFISNFKVLVVVLT